ncbi:secreted RxLR effector protein 161-like [Arachis stenosperma]|uniref:secreted RxLR effector protein 161-like n=1 Tax=Arachis stenosperma TaxID=217475 RepID=UPI0025AD00C1|nr:secreted RxLR effector protein 161-like [Arachis stenosperma]
MDEDIHAIEKNDIWELTDLPTNKKLDTIRMIISLSTQNKWKIHQMDIKSTFLNDTLEEEVYVEQPVGDEVLGEEDKVYKLKKALYRWNIQSQFLLKVEEKFKLLGEDKGRTVNPTYYKSLIRSLKYLTATRLDIVFGIGLLSRFTEESCTNHLQVVKRIFRYIKGTLNDGIYYENTNEINLVGYTNSDWAGDIETRKSTSEFVFHLGSGAISWSSKKQPVVALSTVEAEYIAAISYAMQEI